MGMDFIMTNITSQTEPPESWYADPTPAEILEACLHRPACIMQWERFNGELDVDARDWSECVSEMLGCSDQCDACCF